MTRRFMMIYKPADSTDMEAGRSADPGRNRQDGEVHRGDGEVRSAARHRRAAAELEGRACPPLGRKAHRHRRPLHRDQGADRRLRNRPGQVEGGGDRIGRAFPQIGGRRGERDSPDARHAGLRSLTPIEPETTRRYNHAIHDADDPQGVRKGRTGRHAGLQGRCRNDEVQRVPAKGRRTARARWPSPSLDGCARLVQWRQAQGHGRALRRGAGGARRLLDDPGKIEGRGARRGVALPRRRQQRSDRDSAGAGVRRLPCRCSGGRSRVPRDAGAVQAAQRLVTSSRRASTLKSEPEGDTTMRVMVVIKANKDTETGAMPDEGLLTEMGKFNEELVKAGMMLAMEGLHPSSKGARVKFSGAKRTVIDGPFSEAKELIAGYWLWQ